MRFLAVFLATIVLAVPAHAEWHEASSDHFVVYADDSAKDVQKFAEMLERYHTAMTLLTGRTVATPSPSNRVTIFAVGSERDVARLATGKAKASVAGFYVPRAGASRAFVPDIKISHRETPFSMIVLLHEYAHHFLISGSRFGMPRWLSEGAAEFFASARFPKDGGIEIGRPAMHRVGELAYGPRVSVRALLDPAIEAKEGAFYGYSWALYHHLNFGEGRGGQISEYWKALALGAEPMDAAQRAFGDLDVLQDEVDASLRARMASYYNLSADMVPIGEVTVRQVSEGHGEVLPLVIQSQRGVTREEAIALLPEVQEVAAAYPTDARVLAALAEAEHDAGNYDASIAAADRAIAADPSVKDAYVQKGFSLFALAADAEHEEMDEAYRQAMVPFSRLNALENDHPLPLIYYYRSFLERGEAPSELARAGLERAASLAPFDKSLWYMAALMQGDEGKIELARLSLAPLASDPHAEKEAAAAKVVMRQLQTMPEGEPVNIDAMLALARTSETIGAASAEAGASDDDAAGVK